MKNQDRFLIIGVLIFLLLILGMPHWRRFTGLGSKYTTLLIGSQNVNTISLEETYAYATLANRVKFDQPINDPYVWEYKDFGSPFLSEYAPSLVTGWLAKLAGVPLAIIVIKITGPIVLVSLLYLVGINIGVGSISAMASSIAAVFLPKLFALFPYPVIPTYILGSTDLEFQRVFHPLLSWIAVAGNMVGIQMVFKKKTSLITMVIAGILAGILFYTYFFAWTLVWFGMAILIILLFCQKKFFDLKRLAIVMTVGCLIGLPYFINGLEFSRTVLGREFWDKTVLPAQEIHVATLLRYVLLLGGLILVDRGWWRKSNKLLLWSMLVAAVLLPDLSQFVFGANLESDHWIGRFLYPLSTLLILLAVGKWLSEKNARWNKLFVVVVFILAVFRIGLVNLNEWRKPVENYQLDKQRQELYNFLFNNVAPGSVIGSLSFTEQIYLAAYTPFYPFIPRWDRTIAPNDEPMRRLLFIAQQLEVSEKYFDETMPVPLVPVSYPELPRFDQKALAVVFGLQYLYDLPPYNRHLELLVNIKDRFKNKIKPFGRLDYLLITPTDRVFSKRKFETECNKLFDNNVYQVYRFSDCKEQI